MKKKMWDIVSTCLFYNLLYVYFTLISMVTHLLGGESKIYKFTLCLMISTRQWTGVKDPLAFVSL